MPEADRKGEHKALATLRNIGATSWFALGIIALAVVIAMAVGAISGIVLPLVIAVIVGTVLEPLVMFLEGRGIPRTLATVMGLLTAVVVAGAVISIIVWGFVQQLPEIYQQLALGWKAFLGWGRSLEIDALWLERGRATASEYAPRLGQGILGAVSSTFSGAVAFAMGTFFSIFFLFFVLRDGRRFSGWLSATADLDAELVGEVDTLSKESLRGYFKGIAVTAIVTAPIFMIPLLLLNVPLVGPIFILYFFLSFIPYVGAWLTGAFAILIAFGSGGATVALIVAVSLVISNGTIQSAVSSWALGSSLKMHPVAVLLATIIGGTIAGLIGMVLGPPLLSAVTRSLTAVRERKALVAAEEDASPL